MNIIADLWLYSLIAGNYDNDGDDSFVRKNLSTFRPGSKYTPFFTNLGDYAFINDEPTRLVLTFRGTHGRKGWLSNLKFLPNKEGFHTGFAEGFKKFEWPMLDYVSRNPEKPIEIVTHSRGGPIGHLMARALRKELNRYCKPVLFCSPRLANRRGTLNLMGPVPHIIFIESRNDGVDNIGVNAFWGGKYGTIIRLPKSKEYTFIEKLRDRLPGWGHSYSEVTDGLVQWFYSRGMEHEARYLKTIRYLSAI